ncbi:MAG: aspartate--tRNA ligase [Rhodobacteraceae bacterium]|nr:aspartate--tRNA ligase [Paracoccaceae bacterium]
MHRYRTHTCNDLNTSHANETVSLAGWVHRIRDHGGVLFIDLRDHYGITQVLADPDSDVFFEVEKLKAESVIKITGEVRLRSPELINNKIPTGAIEVYIRQLEVLGEAEELPLPVFGELDYPEETRLKYRFIDLRRNGLHNRIITRSKVISWIRKAMESRGFNEFQTPILTASSPEGARDFLVPSRYHPGKFYALPQAPQQFKQLIMVAGFDRYFQISPCFRDEDPRADRSPGEFYQLDVEMSFATQEDVFNTIEPVIRGVFQEFGNGRPVTEAFPQITYHDALMRYGSDKPDLRNPIKMQTVSEHFAGSGFQIFAKLLEVEGNEIRAIPAPTGGSRRFCDRMNSFAQKNGLPGMGYIFWRIDDNQTVGAGPVAKNIGPERTENLRKQLDLKAGDAAFFLGGKPSSFISVAAKARDEIAKELNLIDTDRFELCWIKDYPLFETDEETGQLDFSHNPFSMPQGGMEALETLDPLDVLGFQYDIVCNGVELSSGAVRNHKLEILYKVFSLVGYSKEFVDQNFSGMVNAFRFGAPPHAGIAPGIDRMIMLLTDVENIREVIVFPLNQRAEDLMLGAPSEPSKQALLDLGIRIAPT